MSKIHQPLCETTFDGARTRLAMLTAEQCPPLRLHRIAHVGLADAAVPFQRVRLQPGGSCVLVSISGGGKILLDGRWQQCRASTACLAPPRVLNAFHAVPGRRWRICWVRYDEPAGIRPVVSAASPVKARCDARIMACAIEGLMAESAGRADARLEHHWIELVHAESQRLARPWHLNDRLWQVWRKVEDNLAAGWSVRELASLAHCSEEHLRRLCLRELGRSPMQQLTSIRMQRAAELLERTDDKLEVIAGAVGYANAFVLSRVFKKWIGRNPSEYRRGRRA
ncbi:MAG: AraC family transcriptional regulator [Limisphaerales bacterium]